MNALSQNPIAFHALLFGIIFSLCAATYQLSEAPGIWYDEGFYTQMALNVSEGNGQTIQVAPGEFVSGGGVTLGFPVVYPVAVFYSLFGAGVFEGRAVMALFLVAFVTAAAYLAHLLFGIRYAAWAALLLASFPMLYGNGKPVLGEVPGLFFLVLTLIALVFLERSGYRNLWTYAGAGLAAGLCVVTKPIFILLTPALLLAWIVHRKEVRISLGGFAAGVIAGLIPLCLWLATQFGSGDTLSSIAAFYANPYESSDIFAGVFENVIRLVTETTPLYLLISLALWGASWFIRNDRVSPAERIAFFFSGFVLLAFLRMPGWYRYLFPALTLSLVFLPYALLSVGSFVNTRLRLPSLVATVPAVVLGALILIQAYQLGFSSYVAQYYGGTRTEALGAHLQALPEGSFFIYDAPEVVILLPHRSYFQFIQPHPNQIFGAENLVRLFHGEPDFVVIGSGNDALSSELFEQYRVRDTVNRYTVLDRVE